MLLIEALLTLFLGPPALNSVLHLPTSLPFAYPTGELGEVAACSSAHRRLVEGFFVGKEITNITLQGFLDQGIDAN